MGDIYTANGTKVFIGTAVTSATDTAAEFAALTWTEIGLAETVGEFGSESNPVTFTPLGDARTRKGKGSRDEGMMSLVVGDDPTDVGQQALIAAEASYSNFAFKVIYPNRLNPTGTDGIDYFRGLVMSKRKNVGSSDNVVRRNFNVGINSPIVEVAPTAGS